MKKSIQLLLFLAPLAFFAPAQNYLSRQGNKLYDKCNKEVRLTGVNWFGFETGNKAPHGLWFRDYQSMLEQIKAMGFNCVRIPWSNEIIKNGAMPNSINTSGTDTYNGRNPMNGDLNGLTSIQVLDKVMDHCKKIGLKVILDNHSHAADGYMNEKLWYTSNFTEQQWIDDWVAMVSRYKSNDAVIAADLDNEPHDNATWGNSASSTDWNKAAERCGNAILSAHPEILIIVEGVEKNNGGYWWGGNLKGVASLPILLSKPEKLVYSPHEYGPEVHLQTWFDSPTFPSNMNSIWNEMFGYINANQSGHILVGEFGIKDSNSFGGKSITWFNEFLKYMGKSYSWTYWCMNPNSGDTGGILGDDWVSVNTWKVNKLKPYMAPLIGACSTGVEDKKRNHLALAVNPNPGNGIFMLESDGAIQDMHLTLLNPLGQVVLNREYSFAGQENQTLDIRQFPGGMYTLHVVSGEKQAAFKIIKFTTY